LVGIAAGMARGELVGRIRAVLWAAARRSGAGDDVLHPSAALAELADLEGKLRTPGTVTTVQRRNAPSEDRAFILAAPSRNQDQPNSECGGGSCSEGGEGCCGGGSCAETQRSADEPQPDDLNTIRARVDELFSMLQQSPS